MSFNAILFSPVQSASMKLDYNKMIIDQPAEEGLLQQSEQ